MALRLPLLLKLNRRALARRDAYLALIRRAVRPDAADDAFATGSFAFKNDEHAFARELLGRKSHYWLFRSNQRAFCGDFVAVDMSAPLFSRRRAFVVELKRGAPLRLGGGGAGVQLRNAERVVRELGASGGIVGSEAPYELVTGDRALILAYFEGAAPCEARDGGHRRALG